MKQNRMIRITLVLLLVAFGSNGSAQTGTGSIRGTVTSPDGPVVAAPVRAKHQSTGKIFSTTSANSGQFALTDLPAGIYEVSVPPIGLANAPFVQRNVNVEAGQTTSLKIALMKGNQGVIGDDNAYLAIHNKYLNVRGRAPRMVDGRPDFSGVWNANVDPNPEPPALLPRANEVWRNRLSTALRDYPAGFCLPDDPTPTIPLLYKFVHTKGILVLLFEHEPHYRQIFLDGRSHPKDADPTWMGHSVGTWDKDTLVIDTVGFNDKSWIIFPSGLPHTEMLHMVERYRRPDLGHLLVDLRLEDPGTFTKPLERHMTWELAPGEEILESICNENNKFPEYAGLK
jgi:Carboxypeptidase regulatory-like domain